MPLGGALTLALVGAAATKYSSDAQKGAQSRAAGIANTGKMGNTAFTPTAAQAGSSLKELLGGMTPGTRFSGGEISTPSLTPSTPNSSMPPPESGVGSQRFAEYLGAAAPNKTFTYSLDDPRSGVGKSGMGDAPDQGVRLKQALATDISGPSAVEGLDAGPEKFAQMNNPAMGAGPKAASSPSWLNADTIGTAAQVAGALASSGGGPPSAGLPNVGSMNYTPTAIRLQQALGGGNSSAPRRF